jgi:hypothetical protein
LAVGFLRSALFLAYLLWIDLEWSFLAPREREAPRPAVGLASLDPLDQPIHGDAENARELHEGVEPRYASSAL